FPPRLRESSSMVFAIPFSAKACSVGVSSSVIFTLTPGRPYLSFRGSFRFFPLLLRGILYLRLELGKGARVGEGEPFLLALRRGYAGDLQDTGIGKIAVVEGLERPGKLP